MIDRIYGTTQSLLAMIAGDKPCTNIRIIIHETQSYSRNLENGAIYPLQNITINLFSKDNSRSKSIEIFDINHAPSSLFESLDENEDIHFYFDKNKTSTTLPHEISAHLIKFLKQGKPDKNPDYCCINFAYELLYGRGVIKDDNSPNYFRGHTFQEEKIKPGTVIYLYKILENVQINREINRHFAIAIGENYYISIHGSTGPIAICSLDAMKVYCQSNQCLEVKKIPEFKITSQKENFKYLSFTQESLENKEKSPESTSIKLPSNLSFFTIAGSIVGGLLGAALNHETPTIPFL
jgi:hypothetical protein